MNQQGELLRTFEQEFGRLMSPFECQEIFNWEAEYGAEIVLQALREAIFNGKRKIRYIDRILFVWEKAGVRTVHEAIEYSKKFREHTFSNGNKYAENTQNKQAVEEERAVKSSIFYNWLEEE